MPPPTDFLSLLVLLCLFASLRPCRAESVSQSRAPKSKPTPIYLDVTPGYKSLSACAELPLSTLIRNMWNGCGDDSGLTSYSCFCTDSYSKFSWDISTAVVSHCGDGLAAQATSAVSVFHEYCASGTTQLFKTAAATKTATQSEFTYHPDVFTSQVAHNCLC